MTTWQVIALLAGAGLGTYLLRYLPMRWYEVLQRLTAGSSWQVVLIALGPAAIVALLVVSVWGLVDTDQVVSLQSDALRIALVFVLMLLFRLCVQNTIAVTFVGVLSYGGLVMVQNAIGAGL